MCLELTVMSCSINTHYALLDATLHCILLYLE